MAGEILNKAEIAAVKAKLDKAKAAVTAAKETAAAKQATVKTAQEAALAALQGRIDFKTGKTDTLPVTQNQSQAAADAALAAMKDRTASYLDVTAAEKEASAISVPKEQYAPDVPVDNKSIYDMLTLELTNLGLSSLVNPLKSIFEEGITDADTLRLRLSQTPEYQTRFSANADRISKGLRALSPAEYVGLEDQYQNIMRNYTLPESYYTKDPTGKQSGFDQLIGNDVDSTELENRIMIAQNRVQNANSDVTKALKAFYPDITNGDILAYVLDPTNGLDMIKRKVTAAEIGGAALSQGLTTAAQSAEDLARYGINKAQAQQGYEQIAGLLPRASMLADVYKQDAYTQAVAEAEVFGTGGAASAAERRKKISELEKAKFSGSSGAASNALSRDRASSQMQYRESGAGAF